MLPARTQLFWGLRTCSGLLSEVRVGCTLLLQSLWWQWDRGAQHLLLAGCWGTRSTHWAEIVSYRLNLLLFLPFPSPCCTAQQDPLGMSLAW